MIKFYKESIKFLMENKLILITLLIYEAFVFPMKLFPRITGVAYFFIALFFSAGILGILQNKEEYGVGMKALLKRGSLYFSKIILNMSAIVIISFVDFIVVLFFTLLPLFVLGAFPNEAASQKMLFAMLIMIMMYRFPLFIMAFFTPVIDKDDYGRFAVVKIKEIFWSKKKIWFIILSQIVIYFLVFGLQLLLFSKISPLNGIVKMYCDFIFDYLKSLLFLVMLIADFLYYKEVIKNNSEFQTRYDRFSYNGVFKGIIGRFIM